MIIQSFTWLALNIYSRTADQLILESGCMFEHPAAARFRDHILKGSWKEASSLCFWLFASENLFYSLLIDGLSAY